MLRSPDASQATALAAVAVAEIGPRPDLLPVRVGVHTGPAVQRGSDRFGNAFNAAGRRVAADRLIIHLG